MGQEWISSQRLHTILSSHGIMEPTEPNEIGNSFGTGLIEDDLWCDDPDATFTMSIATRIDDGEAEVKSETKEVELSPLDGKRRYFASSRKQDGCVEDVKAEDRLYV